ncbi:hypothetical protein Bbelb_210040 [Branchiostoma belcheri]|nr:hypothetical protein Bbelb_210040 [Branchiostoma belcheri]
MTRPVTDKLAGRGADTSRQHWGATRREHLSNAISPSGPGTGAPAVHACLPAKLTGPTPALTREPRGNKPTPSSMQNRSPSSQWCSMVIRLSIAGMFSCVDTGTITELSANTHHWGPCERLVEVVGEADKIESR